MTNEAQNHQRDGPHEIWYGYRILADYIGGLWAYELWFQGSSYCQDAGNLVNVYWEDRGSFHMQCNVNI